MDYRGKVPKLRVLQALLLACLLMAMKDKVVMGDSSEEDSVSPGCPTFLAKVPYSHTDVHNDVCYLFVDDEKYWKSARQECYKLGGEMLTIENQETMDFIAGKLNSGDLGWDRNGVWIGMRNTGGTWRWTNGRPMTYENWADGQPSQLLYPFSFEDCAQMRRKSSWKWHDEICGSLKYHYNYICEFPLSKSTDLEEYVSPSAASQEEDNGNTPILMIIIGMGLAILLLMLIIALLLHVHHRRSKQRQAELPVRYGNNHTSHNSQNYHHSCSSGNSASGGSNSCSMPSTGSTPQTFDLPPGRPPAPPATRSQLEEDSSQFLYSEVNRSRGHTIDFSPNGTNIVTPLTTSNRVNHPQPPSSFTNEQEEFERMPLVNSSVSESSLLGSNHGRENVTTSRFEEAAKTNTQPGCSLVSAGDYVDMNSLITRETQGQAQAAAKGKREAEVPDEDKHMYTNVDQRTEKAENLYEVLP